MYRYLMAFLGISLLFLAACSDSKEDEAAPTCDPVCSACQTCDTSGAKPVCVDNCAAGMTCKDNKCVAPVVATCDPGCGSCQMCDTSGAKPACVDVCGADMTCQDKKCVAKAAATCDPGCKACQMCDTSGAKPVCVDNCAKGTTCQDKKCVAPATTSCEPACGECQMCDTSGAKPICVENCAEGLSCKKGACILPASPCGDKCSSCQVCDTTHGVPFCKDGCQAGLKCDTTDNVCRPLGKKAFDHSQLEELKGPFTSDLAGAKAVTAKCLGCHEQAGQDMLKSIHFKWEADAPNVEGATKPLGKKNLVNNFCIATPSNEKRCTQCHAGYGYVDNTFDFNKTDAMDCLICHASATYTKGAKTGGVPDPTVDLVKAAQSVGSPTRAACGRCHFNAGGGDNVKKGDMGSAMANPAAAADVHMGNAKSAFSCATCHVTTAHKIPGQGVHVPVSEGRINCTDCHGSQPHSNPAMDNHALDIACQTCHIPAFSRQQPTKMDWDWSTAGNKTIGTDGVKTEKVGSTDVHVYHYLKGTFVWKQNVRPQYGWYDGRVTRMSIDSVYEAGAGTKDKPINLGGPIAKKMDSEAKIFPFKVMRGRQPVDPTTRKVLTPKLFGPGGFWGAVPAADKYTAQLVEDNWTKALNLGAVYSGQIAKGTEFTGRAKGAMPWDWGYTEMWMGINHEVALKKDTLSCNKCHGAPEAEWNWKKLGYTCDPMTGGAAKCGSRHP